MAIVTRSARTPRHRWLALLAVLALLAGSCSNTTGGLGRPGAAGSASTESPAPEPAPSGSRPSGSPPPASCPGQPAAPDANRPVIELDFDVADDLTSVRGVETVRFVPDLPTDRLVFRLTANTGPSVDQGNRVDVSSARAQPGGQSPQYERAGADASTQGGLLIIPLDRTVPAGTAISADIEFRVTLGAQSFDRFGRSGGYAWFASAQPLLAWERGVGWHTEPMLQFTAESATSEAASTTVTVTAADGLTVLMAGNPASPTPAGAGRASWRSDQAAARDVSVAVGPFAVRDANATDSSGRAVPLRIGATSEAAASALAAEFVRAVSELSDLLGPFPFPALSVARLPGGGGGIEYPGSILMLDSSRQVAVHETAHQWFYGMVGNSQAEHAWLDEAFASWAEQVVDGGHAGVSALTAPGPVDKPTADYGRDEGTYYFVTYDKGAAALHAASAAVGGDSFQAAIRCYVNANAWTIADPADVAAALVDLPAAAEILQDAGALRR